jgi:hypothetical protein
MARKSAAHDAAKKKAAKQKKRLIFLALPLCGALVYAYMTLTSLNSKPQVSDTPAAQTTPAGSIPADGSAATITPGVTAPPVGAVGSFVALGRKDPFHDNGPHATTGGSSAPKKTAPSKGGSSSKTKQPAAPLTGAVISLNGQKLSLAIGTAFGHAPGLSGVSLFRLITVSARSAVVGVVGTRQHFTLHVRRPLTLAQNGGWTYTLVLEPLGSAAPMTVQPGNQTIADQNTP